mgnify:CR=1 FL=1
MHPISTSRVFWDYALRFLVLATLVVVPLRLAFVHTTNQAQTSLAILLYADVALDALCVLDGLNVRRGGFLGLVTHTKISGFGSVITACIHITLI